jgi:hypothetical protein
MKRATPLELLPTEVFSGSYFCEPVRAWFDPIYAAQGLKRWEPIIQTEKRSSSEASRASSEARDRLIEQGVASALGTIPMVGTPKGRPTGLTIQRRPARTIGDEAKVYAFRGPSVVKTVYNLLQLGPVPLQKLAEQIGIEPKRLSSCCKDALAAKVIVSERRGNFSVYRLGPVKPANVI